MLVEIYLFLREKFALDNFEITKTRKKLVLNAYCRNNFYFSLFWVILNYLLYISHNLV